MILVYGTGKSGTRLERNMDAKTDESAGKCPVMHKTNRDWWPNQLDLQGLHRNSTLSDPMGKGVRLRQGVQEPRPEGRDQGPPCLDDGVAGVVAGRLWPLRRTDDPPNEIEIA